MSRSFFALGIGIFLAACGGGDYSLRNLDNACSIADQRPQYLRAMQRTENKWGVPVAVQMATIWQESRFASPMKSATNRSFGAS